MSKIILGLNAGEINSSACLVRDGVVMAGCPEERFNRQKLTSQFPHEAVDYCLRAAGIAFNQLDAIAQGWHPGAGWQKFNPLVSRSRSSRESYFYSTPDNLYEHSPRTPGDWIRMDSPNGANMPPIYFVQHHRCHAANAFFFRRFTMPLFLPAIIKANLNARHLLSVRAARLKLCKRSRCRTHSACCMPL